MFCVIQEVERKKPNKNGYYKELRVYTSGWKSGTESITHYHWDYGGGRFERPIKKAYRISIHENYREGGKMRKKQFPIGTFDYYELATGNYGLYDWCDSRIRAAAEELQAPAEAVYKAIEKKLEPLAARLQEEFQQTEEYRVHEEHERITTAYAVNKMKFKEQYEVNGDEYDRCYDVFGTLRDPEALKKIQADYRYRKEYEKKSRRQQEKAYQQFYQNFSGFTGSSYSELESSNHSGKDKDILKQFYRVLSKKFHPDANPGTDTSEAMKVLNQLKQEWGV